MEIEKLYSWSSKALALTPGFAIIMNSLYSPPDIDHKLVGGIVEACGCITLIMLVINKKSISLWSNKKKTILIGLFFFLFFAFLIGYIALYWNQVFFEDKFCKCYRLLPIMDGNELKDVLAKYGGVKKAIKEVGWAQIEDAINANKGLLILTKISFIIFYTAIFEFLTISFGIAGTSSKIN